MPKCRACFQESENLFLLDNEITHNFKILTGLDVYQNDGFSQHICKLCYDTIERYCKFRENCIAVDSLFKASVLKEVKHENINENDIKSELDSFSDIVYEDQEYIIEDNKSTLGIVRDSNVSDILEYEREIVPKTRNSKKINKESITTLKKESSVTSKETSQFSCGLCPMAFRSENTFKDHLLTHKDNKCSICFENFTDWWQTLSHRLVHTEDSKQKCCYICMKKFRNVVTLEYHYKKFHSDETNIVFECKDCFRKYTTPTKLRKHMWRQHSNNSYICDICKKSFLSKSSLKIHMAMHINSKSFACNMCDFTCNYRNNLRIHILYKHTSDKICCESCKNWFRDQKAYVKHKCNPRRSAICPVCGKTVSTSLKRHMRSHSTVSEFKCDRCPSAYKSKSALQVHLDKHAGLRTKRCEYCPMAFYSGTVLNKHRRIHTGIKPYVCAVCQKAFTGKNNLKVHMRVHGEDLIKKRVKVDENQKNIFDA